MIWSRAKLCLWLSTLESRISHLHSWDFVTIYSVFFFLLRWENLSSTRVLTNCVRVDKNAYVYVMCIVDTCFCLFMFPKCTTCSKVAKIDLAKTQKRQQISAIIKNIAKFHLARRLAKLPEIHPPLPSPRPTTCHLPRPPLCPAANT